MSKFPEADAAFRCLIWRGEDTKDDQILNNAYLIGTNSARKFNQGEDQVALVMYQDGEWHAFETPEHTAESYAQALLRIGGYEGDANRKNGSRVSLDERARFYQACGMARTLNGKSDKDGPLNTSAMRWLEKIIKGK